MSEQPQSILLDTNAYFRLAISIHPLLQQSFGAAPKYSLYILSDLNKEYRNNTRLQHKFEWVNNREYILDRAAKSYMLRGDAEIKAKIAFDFLADYAEDQKLNLSLVDLRALALGFAENMPVVTDDVGMTKVAEAHSIECWNSIKLLKIMLSAGRIDMEKVTEVLEYLLDQNDLPMSRPKLRVVFKDYFGADCPI